MTAFDIRLQVAIIGAAAVLGASIFALISAAINAYVQRINVERQAEISTRIKLAEFRQAWINNLREHFVELQTKLSNRSKQSHEEITRDLFRILLMLNKDDASIQDVKKLIREALDGDKKDEAQVKLLSIFQTIIKDEWEVTKSDLNSKLKK